MKKFSKAGLLIVTLVIPALIFVFLKFFAKNHYDLPYFNPELDAQGKVVIENGDTLFRKVNMVCPSLGQIDLRNKLTLISSLSGECDADCQTFVTQLQRINSLTHEIPELQILTLTDTLKKVAELPDGMGGGKWSLIRSSENAIDNCLKMSPMSVETSNELDKKWQLMLIDRQGFVRGYYNGKDVKDTDRLIAEIKILDYEGKATK
ncbi:hypothetical protein [Dyadobacter luticola]|uniref:SCO family protein n=1 Tax=Dyadobacter luticola TaxID=1979387 RepID=A0A5R9KPM8_9BACT|nr:hypothetical protein [Dyadobacter luticola]TLU98109.1 hypothetical protein FEN17_25335 [Dyadobacter luticola]